MANYTYQNTHGIVAGIGALGCCYFGFPSRWIRGLNVDSTLEPIPYNSINHTLDKAQERLSFLGFEMDHSA